jgi:hypothetical protein
MRIKLRTLMAGPKGVARPGEIIDVDQETAGALIAGRHAWLVDDEPRIETTSIEPEETAMRKRGRPRKEEER